MIDDSDVDFAAVVANPTTWLGLAAVLAVIVVLAAIANSNEEECESKHCATGQPKVMDHECVCVTAPNE